jgi:hypothetical protein
MKKYIIDYKYTCIRDVTIEAENESEAIKEFHKRKERLGTGLIEFKDISEI